MLLYWNSISAGHFVSYVHGTCKGVIYQTNNNINLYWVNVLHNVVLQHECAVEEVMLQTFSNHVMYRLNMMKIWRLTLDSVFFFCANITLWALASYLPRTKSDMGYQHWYAEKRNWSLRLKILSHLVWFYLKAIADTHARKKW